MSSNSKFLIAILTALSITSCKYEPYNQGKELYEFYCSNCHSSDGTGLEALIPDIRNTEYYTSKEAELACIIKHGIVSRDSNLIMDMPAASKLSNFEISNIINYINHRWNPDFEERHITEIDKDLEGCVSK